MQGLFAQDYEDFDLLVVDSGSRDRTLEIVRDYPCRVIEIEPHEYVPGVVLNMAVGHTAGEIVVFLNSDSVPQHPSVLRNLLGAFDDPTVQAAFARQIPRPDAHAWVRRDYAASFPETGSAPPWITLSLPLAAIRRALLDLRPFYTSAWASEDTEWGNWAKKQGHRIAYVPSAIVMHSHNYTLRQIYGRRFVEGEADAFIYGLAPSALAEARQWVSALYRDWLWCLKQAELAEMPWVPVRRFVYHWAHWQGHRLGYARIKSGDNDLTKGQQIVLTRYE